jgi:urease accessory protein
MDYPHTRISADDFRMPPAFRHLQLAGTSSGQIGGVRLELVAAGGETRLGACYQQIPLRLLPPFHFASEPAALLYLINPTAGLMDGDGHRVDIHARPGSRAVVTGQSATRIHPALRSFATQQWHIRVEDGAQLVILPGPAIPFRGCRYYQRVVIELARAARLIWGDIWLPGRYARGDFSEFFQFERMIQHLEVRREGRLIYRDRFDWRGPWDGEAVRWFLGDPPLTLPSPPWGGEGRVRGASGSLFVTGPVAESPRTTADTLDHAILPLAGGDTCLRWCGPPAEIIREVVNTALRQAASWSGGSCDPPWLLRSNSLAPNHWFSSFGC